MALPYDPIINQQKALATQAYQRALSEIAKRRGQLWQRYGLRGNVNQKTGTIRNLRVDPKNPYGLYQMMLHGQGEGVQNAMESAVSRGLGGSAIGRQPISDIRLGHDVDQLEFHRGLQDQFQGLSSARKQAEFDYKQNLIQLSLLLGRNLIENRKFNQPKSKKKRKK